MNALTPIRVERSRLRPKLDVAAAAAEVNELAVLSQAITDELTAAAMRLDGHACDETGDSPFGETDDVVCHLTPTAVLLAQILPLVQAIREAAR